MNMKQRKTVPIHRNNYNHPTTNSLSVLFCFVLFFWFFFFSAWRERKKKFTFNEVSEFF